MAGRTTCLWDDIFLLLTHANCWTVSAQHLVSSILGLFHQPANELWKGRDHGLVPAWGKGLLLNVGDAERTIGNVRL